MKKIITVVLAGMMLLGAYSVYGGNSYAMTNWDFLGLGSIFGSDSIEGHWTMVGYYDCGEYTGVDDPDELNGEGPEITFYEDGTFSAYSAYDDMEFSDGYWEEGSDGYYVLDSLLGTEASVEAGKLYISGLVDGYTMVFAR